MSKLIYIEGDVFAVQFIMSITVDSDDATMMVTLLGDDNNCCYSFDDFDHAKEAQVKAVADWQKALNP